MMPQIQQLNGLIQDSMIARANRVDRYSLQQTKEYKALLNRLRDRTTNLIRQTPASDVRFNRLGSLFNSLATTYLRFNEQLFDKYQRNLFDLATGENKFIGRMFNSVFKVGLFTPPLNKASLRSIVNEVSVQNQTVTDWWKNTNTKFAESMRNGKIRQRINDSIAAGILEGRTNDQMKRDMRDLFKDVNGAARRNYESLIRTGVIATLNDVNDQAFKELEEFITVMKWTSTLDKRTTMICKARDGLLYKVNGDPVGHGIPKIGPPAHFRCRSIMVAQTKSYDELFNGVKRKEKTGESSYLNRRARELGVPVDNLLDQIKPQRAAMGGPVAADVTYGDWLKRQSEDIQRDALGKGRHDLWKAGKIGMKDLISKEGKPLTLRELENNIELKDLTGG